MSLSHNYFVRVIVKGATLNYFVSVEYLSVMCQLLDFDEEISHNNYAALDLSRFLQLILENLWYIM